MIECSKCKDSQYLHNGECVATCPAGFTESGTGTFGRVCEGSRRSRRSILPDITSESSATRSPAVLSSGLLVIVGTVLVIVAVVRRSSKPTKQTEEIDLALDADLESGPIPAEDEPEVEAPTALV